MRGHVHWHLQLEILLLESAALSETASEQEKAHNSAAAVAACVYFERALRVFLSTLYRGMTTTPVSKPDNLAPASEIVE